MLRAAIASAVSVAVAWGWHTIAPVFPIDATAHLGNDERGVIWHAIHITDLTISEASNLAPCAPFGVCILIHIHRSARIS